MTFLKVKHHICTGNTKYLNVSVAALLEQCHQEGLNGLASVYTAFGTHLQPAGQPS